MMTFDEALTLLDTPAARRYGRRKLANNTYLHLREDGRIGIQLHDTDVVILAPDHVELQSGGWYTMTTKARMDEYAPCRVGSVSGAWYLFPDYWSVSDDKPPAYPSMDFTREDWEAYQGSDEYAALVAQYEADYEAFTERRKAWEAEHPAVAYFDGIRIAYDGEVLNGLGREDEDARLREREAMKRRIAAYVKLVKAELPGLREPDGGDCWFCLMHAEDGKSLGDASGDHSHLLDHMDEGYVVPSLIWNAVVESGYRVPAYVWKVEPIATRCVRKYLTKRLVDTPAGYQPAGVVQDRSTGGFTVR